VAAGSGTCRVQKRTDTYPAGGGHPAKDSFEPTEQAPATSFGHVLGDGFVIVHYHPGLPADQLAQLRTDVTDPASGRIVGGPEPAQAEPVKAVHAYQTELVCSSFDLAAVQQFAAGWFAGPPVEAGGRARSSVSRSPHRSVVAALIQRLTDFGSSTGSVGRLLVHSLDVTW
jgi:hypothetical protein